MTLGKIVRLSQNNLFLERDAIPVLSSFFRLHSLSSLFPVLVITDVPAMDQDEHLRNEFRKQYRRLEERVLAVVSDGSDVNILSLVGTDLDNYISLFEQVHSYA